MTTHARLLVCCCLMASSAAAQQGRAPGAPVQLTPAEEKAADMRLPRLDRTDLTPDSREPVKVKETERNPFSFVAVATDERVPAEPVKEETKLRQLFTNLRVTGFSDAPGGRRVLLGSLSLGVGDEVPRLFSGQAEKLSVQAITERGVVLKFLETDGSRDERSILVPFDIKARRPNELLVGEVFRKVVPISDEGESQLPPLGMQAAKAALDAAKSQDLRSMIPRRTELMDSPAIPAIVVTDDKKKKP